MTAEPRVGGVILCGGRSSRMGQAKAWLPFGGEVMLQRVVRIVRGVVDPVVVVAAPGQELPPLPPEVLIARDEAEGCGPLQGLAMGLKALAGRAEAVYLTSCDAPFLRMPFLERVIFILREPTISAEFPLIACPKTDRLHPLAAAYRVNVLPTVLHMLASGQLRMTTLLELASVRPISEEELRDVDPELESLWNLNTPEDYERALRSIERITG